jgi:hypothetical protein
MPLISAENYGFPAFFPGMNTHPKSITDSEIDAILADAIARAENAAGEAVRSCGRVPRPFASHQEWHAFDAALDGWLARNEGRKAGNAA